jgi:hypothetical protein
VLCLLLTELYEGDGRFIGLQNMDRHSLKLGLKRIPSQSRCNLRNTLRIAMETLEFIDEA